MNVLFLVEKLVDDKRSFRLKRFMHRYRNVAPGSLRKFVIATALAATLASCDRQKNLINEKAKVEESLLKLRQEHRSYEEKFLSLGPHGAATRFTMERQVAELDRGAIALEVEVRVLENKASDLEAAIAKYKPLVDQYKAQFAR